MSEPDHCVNFSIFQASTRPNNDTLRRVWDEIYRDWKIDRKSKETISRKLQAMEYSSQPMKVTFTDLHCKKSIRHWYILTWTCNKILVMYDIEVATNLPSFFIIDPNIIGQPFFWKIQLITLPSYLCYSPIHTSNNN